MIHRGSVLHQQRAGERSAGAEGKQVIQCFGVVTLGVDRLHRKLAPVSFFESGPIGLVYVIQNVVSLLPKRV